MYILTYNVSWQSMTGERGWKLCNSKDENSSKYYGVCQKNITQFVDQHPFRIVALQEASNYKMLVAQSKLLKKLKHIVHKVGNEEMVTFFHPQLPFIKHTVGSFEQDSRPYQILYFRNFCFVNVHLGHYSEYVLKQKMNVLIKEINYSGRIIIAGDFNMKINTSKTVDYGRIFFTSTKALHTCCEPSFAYQPDHIIDTKESPSLMSPQIDMASDHNPVIGYIK